jgi:hypothetical protein
VVFYIPGKKYVMLLIAKTSEKTANVATQ